MCKPGAGLRTWEHRKPGLEADVAYQANEEHDQHHALEAAVQDLGGGSKSKALASHAVFLDPVEMLNNLATACAGVNLIRAVRAQTHKMCVHLVDAAHHVAQGLQFAQVSW